MQRQSVSKERARIGRCIRALLDRQPFFGTLAIHMNVVEDNSRRTIACDGDAIYYNAKWVAESDAEVVKAGVARIVLACALKHHTRRQQSWDYGLWQQASAAVTMPILQEQGMAVSDSIQGVAAMLPGGDMSAEQAYKLLRSMATEDKGGGKGGEQGGGGEGTQGGNGEGEGEGTGDGRPDSQDPTNSGEIMDRAPDANGNGNESDQMWDERVQQAMQAARAAGNEPGSLKSMISGALNAKLDWRSIFREFMTEVAKEDYSWSHPSRRFLDEGLYMPSLHSEAMQPIIFAIDTSASMDNESLSEVWSEIRGSTDIVNPERIMIIHCDTKVQQVDEYESRDLPETIEAKGRGGTRVRPVFEYLKEKEIEPSVLIYHTDLEVYDFGEDPGYPVLWAWYEYGSRGQRTRRDLPEVPFGEVLDVRE